MGLLAGWFPCPLLTVAGRQLGAVDARDLFPGTLLLVRECESAAMVLGASPALSREVLCFQEDRPWNS